MLRTVTVTVLVSMAALVVVGDAIATYPGRDGVIAYVDRQREFAEGSDIFGVKPDGRGPVNLTGYCSRGPAAGQMTDMFIETPDWSPDGSRLVHGRDRSFAVFPLAGGAPRTVGPDASGGATWSPDGGRLAFWGPAGNADIWTMNADGTGRRNLTNTPDVSEFDPAWSPDGSKLAFTVGQLFGDLSLAVMPADGGPASVLADRAGSSYEVKYHNPDWSPDGTRLAVGRELVDEVHSGIIESAVFVLNADGSGLRKLTAPDVVTGDPSWSPSGRRIAYSGPRPDGEPGSAVWTINPDGSQPVAVAVSSASSAGPDWGTAKSVSARPCAGAPEKFGALRRTATAVSWRLGCPEVTGPRCRVSLSLKPTGRSSRSFGRATGRIEPGRELTLRVRLNRAARRTLNRQRRLRVRVTATVTQGLPDTAKRTVTFRVRR